jgi:hypothetical protein
VMFSNISEQENQRANMMQDPIWLFIESLF